MRKFKGQFRAAFIVVSVTAAGTAFAQSPDDPMKNNPNDPLQPADPTQPTSTDEARKITEPAEPPTIVVSPPPPAPVNVTVERERSGMMNPGFSLSFGGGVADFTDQGMRDTTSLGGTWAVRAAIGTRAPLAFEASYIGSAQEISALGIDNNSLLVSNGLQGALRLNAVIGAPVTPFIFGGVAWSHFDLANTSTNTSAISGSDDLIEVPVGLGVGGSWRGFGYDVRGELRFATEEDMVPDLSGGRDTGRDADMHRWGVSATLGYGF
jgi:hypothetical protein